jgi:hypothetical protein
MNSTIERLNYLAQNDSRKVSQLSGRDLEPFVKNVMEEMAKNTPFEGSIKLIGGQKFPDITAKNYYGIEIKTTRQNHWKSTGNSVLETTRVHNVERVFLLFAKLATPIEFRCRPYEEVLSEVVVTHSPRYLIDMNLKNGETIFNKINMPYDKLRKMDDPIRPIVNYYKSKLKPGEELWWMDVENTSKASNIIIRIWNNLAASERQELTHQAMAYFPELFGSSNKKYGRLAIWLTTRKTVVCPNVRDSFSAGGRAKLKIEGEIHEVPKIFGNLYENAHHISEVLLQTPAFELAEYWEEPTSDESKISDWISLVARYSKTMKCIQHIDIKQILTDIIV